MDLLGRTTLADARRRVKFRMKLPSYPRDLGEPGAVFVQPIMGGEMVVLVWFDTPSGGQTVESPPIRLVLYEFTGEVTKDGFPASKRMHGAGGDWLEETTVGDSNAAWMRAPHELLYTVDGQTKFIVRRLVSDNVLVWSDDNATYHLEGPSDLVEARRIAESLR